MRPFYISALAISLIATQAAAEEGHKHLDAHEHGAGELMVALEGSELLIELRLPGMDVVGFEHAPENHAQHEAIDTAADKLKTAANVVELPGAAKCALEEAHIKAPFAEDKHENEHGHEKEHGHDEHKDEHKGEMHSEFMAEYHFHCDAPQNVDTLNVKAFATFPTLEEVDYQLVGPKGQKGGELEPHNTKIAF